MCVWGGGGESLFKDKWVNIEILSNFNGSNIFGAMETCSRYGQFEPLRVNHGARSGSK